MALAPQSRWKRDVIREVNSLNRRDAEIMRHLNRMAVRNGGRARTVWMWGEDGNGARRINYQRLY